MKRAPFLGAAGAALLAGCGGSHVMRALPGVAPSNISHSSQPALSGRLEPQAADPIPDNVLNNPIMGEARRFDGAVAPHGWMLAQGQALDIAQNRHLFSILGVSAGGDRRTTFKLPAPRFGLIVATAGLFPTSPEALAQSSRRTTLAASLGPNARPGPVRAKNTKREEALLAERRLRPSAIRVSSASPIPLSRELRGRIQQAEGDARSAVFGALTTENQARLESAVRSAVAGEVSVSDAVRAMIAVLSRTEAETVVRANDALIHPFNDRWAGEPEQDLQLEAATFLISIMITREQAHTIYLRERATER